MKRIFVLIAVLALLVAGTVSVLADPIHIGGGRLTTTLSSIPADEGPCATALAKVPAHAKANGLGETVEEEPDVTVLLSPIHIGGGR